MTTRCTCGALGTDFIPKFDIPGDWWRECEKELGDCDQWLKWGQRCAVRKHLSLEES
jgi:hypothetical protein